MNLKTTRALIAGAATAAAVVASTITGLVTYSQTEPSAVSLAAIIWPTPQNTGVPAGTVLTPYTGSLSPGCGTVIDSKIVNGDLTISAGNGTHSAATPCVTIKNSLIKGIVNDFWTSRNAGPVLMLDNEVANPKGRDVAGVSDSNLFMWRNYVHGARSGVQCDGFCELHDNYLLADVEFGSAHMDAFITNGNYGNPIILDHNSFLCAPKNSVPNGAGCAADVGTFPDFSSIINLTMTNNIFRATGDAYYCLHSPYEPAKKGPNGEPYGVTGKNNTVTNNVWEKGSSGKCASAAPVYDWNNSAGKWCNNVFDDGKPVLPGNTDNCGSTPPSTVTTTTVVPPTTVSVPVSTVPAPTSTTTMVPVPTSVVTIPPASTVPTTKPPVTTTTTTNVPTFTCTQIVNRDTHAIISATCS